MPHSKQKAISPVRAFLDAHPEVQTIEPEPFDLSAFDVELDPRRVPTFGVIVEGAEAKKKRKAPKLPSLEDADYRPPQPPAQDPEPPPPVAPDDFGDW